MKELTEIENWESHGKMIYRIHIEPIDVTADSPEAALDRIKYREGFELEVCKVAPIDERGFEIVQRGKNGQQKK